MIGWFIQEDTYYGDGLNLYEYCRNNTITYKDPTGHNICATQRDLYHKYKEEGMSPQEAYQKMRKELGLDSKSGYKDSGVGNGKDPWRSYESGKKTVVVNGKTVTMDNSIFDPNFVDRQGRTNIQRMEQGLVYCITDISPNNLYKFSSAALSSIDVATATPHSSALQMKIHSASYSQKLIFRCTGTSIYIPVHKSMEKRNVWIYNCQ